MPETDGAGGSTRAAEPPGSTPGASASEDLALAAMRRFRDAFESGPVGMALATRDGRSVEINRALASFLGLGAEDLAAAREGRPDAGDEARAFQAYLSKVVAECRPSRPREEQRFRRADGAEVWGEVSGMPLPSADGAPEYCFIVIDDITGRKADQALSERLLAAIDAFSERVVLYDEADRLVFGNKAFRDVNKAVSETLTPGTPYEIYLRAAVAAGTMPEAVGREEAWIAWRLDRHRNPSGPFELHRDNGRVMRIHEERLEQGGSVTIATDITEQKRAETELRRLATSDPLTGAANRRFLLERADAEWVRSRRYGRPLAVLMLDIDHFKRINDTHGHPVGDEALRALTAAIGTRLRNNDLLGRLGGEEFMVLLPETGLRGAQAMAERLRAEIAAIRIETARGPLSFTASFGVAVCIDADGSFERGLARADAALYAAKRSGRNRVEVALEDAAADARDEGEDAP